MTSMFVKYCGIHLFVGLSTDEKPTNAPNASRFYEMDTKTTFIFDKENEEWVSQNDVPEGDKMVAIYFEQSGSGYYGYKDESKTPFTSVEDAISFIGNNPIMLISLDEDGESEMVLFPIYTYHDERQFIVGVTDTAPITIDDNMTVVVVPMDIILSSRLS